MTVYFIDSWRHSRFETIVDLIFLAGWIWLLVKGFIVHWKARQ